MSTRVESEVMVSLRDDQFNTSEVPLFICEKQAGNMRVTKSGLYTVFEAELPGHAEELVRLWAHGKGSSAYLGVMQPGEGGLCFSRKLSRRELSGLPEAIELVSDQKEKLTENNLHNIGFGAVDEEKESEPDREAESEQYPAEKESAAALPQTDYNACPWPAEPAEEELLWYRRPDGSLVTFDGISNLLALPAELRAPTPRAAERVIEGKKYLVFRT